MIAVVITNNKNSTVNCLIVRLHLNLYTLILRLRYIIPHIKGNKNFALLLTVYLQEDFKTPSLIDVWVELYILLYMRKSIIAILKSPILHFLILGIIVFILYDRLKPEDRETINITSQTIDALIQQQEEIRQYPLTEKEKQTLIEGHIKDEILLREAFRRGMDKNDYRVRKRLLNMMRSSLTEVVPEPSVAQLKAYYKEISERYQTDPSRSFENVFFSFTNGNQPVNPEEFITQLEGSPDPSALGEYSQLGNKFTKSSFRQTALNFGKPFAERLLELPLNEWSGPVESIRGTHYIMVTENHDPELPPFEEMGNYLRQDYLFQKTREIQEQKITEMREGYEIIVEGQEKTK